MERLRYEAERLSRELELELILAAKNGCSDSANRLFCGHYPFFLKQCDHYIKWKENSNRPEHTFRKTLDIDDLLSVCFIQSRQAISKFDPTRSTRFLTYCGKYLWRWFNNADRANFRQLEFCDQEELEAVEYLSTDEVEEVDFAHATKEAIRKGLLRINELRIRKSLRMRFLQDPPLKLREIGGHLGVSKERTRQLISRGLREIRRYLEETHPDVIQHFSI